MHKNIFVGCLPFGFTEDDIRRQFEPFGQIESVQLFQDLENATFDSYAHVSIDSDDVDRLLEALDGKVVGKWPLRVNEVVTREDKLQRAELTDPDADICLRSA